MADKVEDLTVNFNDDDGTLLCREMDKKVLTKGTWSTLMFMYQDFDKAKGDFKAPKYAIRRYQKQNGEYKLKSKFAISSNAQAKQIVDILSGWIGGATDDAGAEGGDE